MMTKHDPVPFEAGFVRGWDALAKALMDGGLTVDDLGTTFINPVAVMLEYNRWAEQDERDEGNEEVKK